MRLKCVKDRYEVTGGGGGGGCGGGQGGFATVNYVPEKIKGLTVGNIYIGFLAKDKTGYNTAHMVCMYNDDGNWVEYHISYFAPLGPPPKPPREFKAFVDGDGLLHNVNLSGGMKLPLTPIKLREVK